MEYNSFAALGAALGLAEDRKQSLKREIAELDARASQALAEKEWAHSYQTELRLEADARKYRAKAARLRQQLAEYE